MIDPAAIQTVLKFLLPSIQQHRLSSTTLFVLGLSGLQGSGKSTWAKALVDHLVEKHIKTRTLSLDDLYLDHHDLKALREQNLNNSLLHTRGQPGTHDEDLAEDFFRQVHQARGVVKWPAYDKSLHSGQGGRLPLEDWVDVNLSRGLDVLIFEGWCVGFQPLPSDVLEDRWNRAHVASTQGHDQRTNTLQSHQLRHLTLIKDSLQRYCRKFMGVEHFNGFLHLSTDELVNVYQWRLDQEHALRARRPGMSDDEVDSFVRGYMPGYELYLDALDMGLFTNKHSGKSHVKVVMDKKRHVLDIRQV